MLVSAFPVRFLSGAAISLEMQRYPVLSSHLDGTCSNHCVICGQRCWEFAVAVRILWLGSGFFVQQRLFVPVVSANKGRVIASLPDLELSMINEIVKCHVTFQIRLRHFGPGRSVLNLHKRTKKEQNDYVHPRPRLCEKIG